MRIKKIFFNSKYNQFDINTCININNGFNVFVGENGMGKSTILNLINKIFSYNEIIFTTTQKQISLHIELSQYIYERIICILILLTLKKLKIKEKNNELQTILRTFFNNTLLLVTKNNYLEFCIENDKSHFTLPNIDDYNTFCNEINIINGNNDIDYQNIVTKYLIYNFLIYLLIL